MIGPHRQRLVFLIQREHCDKYLLIHKMNSLPIEFFYDILHDCTVYAGTLLIIYSMYVTQLV